MMLDQGYRITIAAPPDDFLNQIIKDPNVNYLPLFHLRRTSISPWQEGRFTLEIKRLLKSLNPDLVLSYTIKPVIHASWWSHRSKIPHLAVLPGLGSTFIRHSRLNQMIVFLYRYLLPNNRYVLFENEHDRDLFIAKSLVKPSQALAFKGCGVDTSYFTPLEKTQPSEVMRFLFLGRLLNEKGIREYIDAAKMMSDKHPNTRFWILGHIDEQNPGAVVKKSFMQWIRHPAIEYLGFEKDVRNVIRECDVVVLPSYYPEGVPRVLQEGMAMGKPIITTDMPGCREAIEQEVNGILVPPKDSKALFDAFEFIHALSPQERLKMGRAGRMKAIREFDEKISNQHYLELIDSILNVPQRIKNQHHKPT